MKKTTRKKTEQTTGRKKKFTKIAHGIVHLTTTDNNTILTLSKENGDVLAQASPAMCGFKNCRKNTPHAIQTSIEMIMQRASEDFGIKTIALKMNGFGAARDMISFFQNSKIQLLDIEDVTLLPYNGSRRSRPRRN